VKREKEESVDLVPGQFELTMVRKEADKIDELFRETSD